MFFFYAIFSLLIILTLLILFTTIQIHIENLIFKAPKIKGRNINKDYKITIKLYILNKINFLKLDITKTKLEKRVIRKNINKLKKKIEKDKNKVDIKILKNLNKLNLKINELKLEIYISLEDANLNAISVGMVSGMCGIMVGTLKNKNILQKNNEQNYWKIIPLYQNKNSLEIQFSANIELKIINIIYFMIGQKMSQNIAKKNSNDIIRKNKSKV